MQAKKNKTKQKQEEGKKQLSARGLENIVLLKFHHLTSNQDQDFCLIWIWGQWIHSHCKIDDQVTPERFGLHFFLHPSTVHPPSTLDYNLQTFRFLFHSKRICFNSLKGTNGRQKTYEIFHVYCIFYSGFMCQTTVIFGITKDGSLVWNTLASWNCFTCRNLFQNGANDMSECLTCATAFCKKAQNFV